MLWLYWGKEWNLDEKVSINGLTKTITVNAGVTNLDIREEVWSAWIRWIGIDSNARFMFAMRYSGLDPIPGGETGCTFFLINGWKLVVDLSNIKITGVLYSEDYDTPFYGFNGNPLYPTTVSAIVLSSKITTEDLNIVVPIDEIATATSNKVWNETNKTITGSTGNVLTPEQIEKLNKTSTKQDVYNASMI